MTLQAGVGVGGTNECSGLDSTSPWSWKCRCAFICPTSPFSVSASILLRLAFVMVL